jgi:hypothetical protein
MVRVVKPPTKDEMSVGWVAPHPMAKVLPSLMDTSVGDLGDQGGRAPYCEVPVLHPPVAQLPING